MEKFQYFTFTDSNKITDRDLDHEWVKLIQEALIMGITKEEIRHFLLSYEGINQQNH